MGDGVWVWVCWCLVCEFVGLWVRRCVGVWVCECVGVLVCGCGFGCSLLVVWVFGSGSVCVCM